MSGWCNVLKLDIHFLEINGCIEELGNTSKNT